MIMKSNNVLPGYMFWSKHVKIKEGFANSNKTYTLKFTMLMDVYLTP